MREAVAESERPGDAVLDRQGQLGDAAPGAQGVLPVAAAVPAAARRHHLEVPGDVRVPRPDGRGARAGPARPPEPGVRRAGASTRSTTARRCTPTSGRPRGSSRRWTSTASTPPSAAPGATRRSRAPRSGSSRSARPQHRWDPKKQRPELWRLYNARKHPGESVRVFPLSNWTELDVWQYIHLRADPDRAAVLRRTAAGGRARRHADHGRRRPHAARRPARCPRCAASASAPSAATR